MTIEEKIEAMVDFFGYDEDEARIMLIDMGEIDDDDE